MAIAFLVQDEGRSVEFGIGGFGLPQPTPSSYSPLSPKGISEFFRRVDAEFADRLNR
jgi:hypothetical protein